MKRLSLILALAGVLAAAVGCNPEPKEASVEFASKTYGYAENQVYGYIGLMELNSPEQFPVVVDVKATFKAGKDDKGNTLTLKIKFHDFTQVSRSHTTDTPLTTLKTILPLAKELLKKVEYHNHPIRLIGLSVSNTASHEQALTDCPPILGGQIVVVLFPPLS